MEKLLLVVFGPLVFAAAILVIAVVIRRAVVRLRSRPNAEQLHAKREAYRSRLLNPQAAAGKVVQRLEGENPTQSIGDRLGPSLRASADGPR